MPESPGAEKQDKEKEHRDSKKGESAMSNALTEHKKQVRCIALMTTTTINKTNEMGWILISNIKSEITNCVKSFFV